MDYLDNGSIGFRFNPKTIFMSNFVESIFASLITLVVIFFLNTINFKINAYMYVVNLFFGLFYWISAFVGAIYFIKRNYLIVKSPYAIILTKNELIIHQLFISNNKIKISNLKSIEIKTITGDQIIYILEIAYLKNNKKKVISISQDAFKSSLKDVLLELKKCDFI